MGNDNPPFKEFQKRRDAMHAAVERAWKFPDPVAAAELAAEAADKAAAEAVAEAHSADGKKSGEVRRENSLTAPHEDEALELLKKTRRLKPKTSSTYSIGKVMAEKFGGSGKTWERFITAAEDEGLAPKQLKT